MQRDQPRRPGYQPGPAGCRVCRAPETHLLLRVGDADILRCERCGAAFTGSDDPVPSSAELYDAGYFTGGVGHYADYVADEETHRRQARRYLRRLRRAGYGGGRLLDIGCAAGFFLDEARRAGWDVHGVEVSPYAATVARDRFGLDVAQGDFVDVPLDAAPFDVVTFFNVFEHLPRPREVVARLEAVTHPGALVLVETWDVDALAVRLLGARWHQWDARFVPYYFSERAFRHIFDAGRWQLRWEAAAKWISAGRGLSILAGGLPDGRARRLLDRLAAGALGSVDVPYFAGDLVMAQLVRR